LGTILFDWTSVRHAMRRPGVMLTLGYNTAVFNLAFRWTRRRQAINMDGIEWRRAKWGLLAKMWLFLNEKAALRIADRLIADHPEIASYLDRPHTRHKITMIPYGTPQVDSARWQAPLDLAPGSYALVVARPEPENSILPIVRAFAAQPRSVKLVVLGTYRPEIPYHRQVQAAASSNVLFPGAVYDKEALWALRTGARLYIHGHTVGGTNPSLVEALAAGSPILAHDNPFNRWVAGEAAMYFRDETDCRTGIDRLLEDPAALQRRRASAIRRHREAFSLDEMVSAYERLLLELSGDA
jgi:glycosyltransferase involved in cell wall biosynthesis